MSSLASLIFLFLFSFLTSFRASAQNPYYLYHYCPNTTTYSSNSTYSTNLKTLLSSLSSRNASYSTGFQNATAGQAPNRVTGLFLCRGDVSPAVCRNCVAFAVNESLIRCPEEREAVFYYEECILRYSHKNILSTLTYEGGLIMKNNNNISSNQNQIDRFKGFVSSTLSQAATEAANRSRKFYTIEAELTAFQTLYGLLQCTPDLKRQDCLSCLQSSINAMALYSIGGRVAYPSCNARYELYVFYNETFIRTSPPLPSTSPSPSPSPPLPLPSPPPPPPLQSPVSTPPMASSSLGKGGNSNALVVAIAVPIMVAVLL